MRSYIEKFKAAIGSVWRRKHIKVWSETAFTLPSDQHSERILFVANAFIPTLQLSFLKPLAPRIERGTVVTDLLSEFQMKEKIDLRLTKSEIQSWIKQRIEDFKPTIMVFCRYSGPHGDYITSLAEKLGIPTVFHVDDDLLNVPVEIGLKKHEFHNRPARLETVRHLLEHVDVVYCSTAALEQRFVSYGFQSTFKVGEIYCSGKVLAPAVNRPVKKIGYMGFDHAHDLEMVLPALIQVLRRNPEVEFELFGSIPKPTVLDEFGDRIHVIPPIPNYGEFLEKFATLNWDVGICPLANTDFNAVKANTKWVEYTSVGTAVVASGGTIYDACCSDGCGLLATNTKEWADAIEVFIHNSKNRSVQVTKAQKRLSDDYSIERLEAQVLEVLEVAHKKRAS
ncbi:glycosyltransferase [Pseudomonas syringae]|uniref:glycosyltransferase n=1 Tax=Pseudomonas syringae TaxID=317 RepID=UPI00040AE88F|nr:glycosyltransferase [Pseudomonas syringae]